MGIKNLDTRVSDADIEKIRNKRNNGGYAEGFTEEVTDDSWADLLMKDTEDTFNIGDTTGFYTDENDSTANGGANQGVNNGAQMFGGAIPSVMNGGQFPNTGVQPIQGQVEQKEDFLDRLVMAIVSGTEATCHILVESIKSSRNRTADDWGYYCTNLIKVGGIFAIAGILVAIWAAIGGIEVLSIRRGLSFSLIVNGGFMLGLAVIGISLSALYIQKNTDKCMESLDTLDEIQPTNMESNSDYEKDVDDMFADYYGDDDEDEYWNTGYEEPDYYEPEQNEQSYSLSDVLSSMTQNEEPEEPEPNEIDTEALVEDVPDDYKGILNRKILFDTFKSFLPRKTQDFNYGEEITKGTDKFEQLETAMLKAISYAAKEPLDAIIDQTELSSAYETYFTYELRVLRLRKLTRLEDIEREVLAYFKEPDDDSVSCKCDIVGDFYKVVINKGARAMVTLGDVIELPEVEKFICNEGKKLPFVAGISIDGKPMLADAKDIESMLIVGLQRSGKSWYVLQILMTLMVFNNPEKIQFIIVDPKESTIFKSIANMPHIAGLHPGDRVMKVLNDVINIEAPRRKKLLADNNCEDIWELHKRGIELPILYIVIDEFLSLANDKSISKELTSMLMVIQTQFPSLGIRFMLVSHRAQGVVDKTIRSNMGFIAAIRAKNEVVCETLGVTKWKIPLASPGDMALYRKGADKDIEFARSPVFTPTDKENRDLIKAIATAYYKMGFDMPDMSTVGSGFNRNEEKVMESLSIKNKDQRFHVNLNKLDDVDLTDSEPDNL